MSCTHLWWLLWTPLLSFCSHTAHIEKASRHQRKATSILWQLLCSYKMGIIPQDDASYMISWGLQIQRRSGIIHTSVGWKRQKDKWASGSFVSGSTIKWVFQWSVTECPWILSWWVLKLLDKNQRELKSSGCRKNSISNIFYQCCVLCSAVIRILYQASVYSWMRDFPDF